VVLQNEPIRYVFTEAATGDNSLGFLTEYGSPRERERIARSYLRRGLLKGSEYLSMTQDLNFHIWGVEDKDLYTDSMEAYDTVVRTREILKAFLNRIEATIQSLGPKILNSEVQRFHRQHEAYLNEELALTDFFEALINESRLQAVSLEEYSYLKIFKRLRQMESRIDRSLTIEMPAHSA
jgi:hypothetical protein